MAGALTSDDQLLRHALWRLAAPLDFAWFGLVTKELQQQYRNAQSELQSLGQRQMMELEARSALAHGEAIALGFLVHPRLSDEVVEVPQFLFESPDTEIDWGASTISGLGRRYESVRAGRPKSIIDVGEDLQPPAGERQTIEVRKGRGGRRDTYSQSVLILRDLYVTEENRHLSAGALHPGFAAAFRQRFPSSSPPTERTLRDQLKRFRQELEETGNNHSSS